MFNIPPPPTDEELKIDRAWAIKRVAKDLTEALLRNSTLDPAMIPPNIVDEAVKMATKLYDYKVPDKKP